LPDPQSVEGQILSGLKAGCHDLAELAAHTGLAVRGLQRSILALELEGLVLSVPGRRYHLSPLAMSCWPHS
jgi:predicted Rossmann fold nucleotide-binding protein DprA/Smf involved in DNA uptake